MVLAFQRYGRGKALVMPVQDTWMWRMHAKMDLKDKTHHTFWQRLVRWVVDGVPDRVMASVTPDRVQRGEPFTITAEVSDPDFVLSLFDDPEMVERGWVASYDHPVVGRMDAFGLLFDFSETPGVVQGPPFLAGQHSREILAETGRDDDAIAALVASGAVLALE